MNAPRHHSGSLAIFAGILFSLIVGGLVRAENGEAPELWFYYATNLQTTENLKPLESVFRRAAAAGYTQVLLTDSKFARLDTVTPVYFENAEKVKKLAEELHLEIVPAVFPIGYSEAVLSHNPDLVESLPVRDALFVVKKGEAHPIADPPVNFPDYGFTDEKHWKWVDPETVHFENGIAHVTAKSGKNARIMQELALAPFHQYHICVRIKTRDFKGPVMVQVLVGGDAELNFADLDVKPTQDWAEYHVVFNSLENKTATISFRAGYDDTPAGGEVWWEKPVIEEAGLLNIVRRDSTPLMVSVDESGWGLHEGENFDAVRDPKMGHTPWAGAYDVWHEPPVMKTHDMPDGTKLRVSFCHSITTGDGKVMICPSEPQTVELLRDQARRVEALWHPKRYFMEHDEIRVLGWDPADEKRGLTSGALLADNLRTCMKILQEVNPKATLYIWSDMFDKFHNAADTHPYYLVKGKLEGSWEGLDPSVVVANWNFGKWEQSLAWFTKRGNPQLIAGYYDSNPEKITDLLKRAGTGKGIEAVMYTTWENKYDDLEKFAESAREYHQKDVEK